MSSSSRPCPSCHRQLCLPADLTEQKVRCRACGAVFPASAFRTEEIVAFTREDDAVKTVEPMAEIVCLPSELSFAPPGRIPARNRGLAYLMVGALAIVMIVPVAWTIWLLHDPSPSTTQQRYSAVASNLALPAPSVRQGENRQAMRNVKGRRSEDGEATRATVRMRSLDKKYEDLRQEEEREQAQFEEAFRRHQQEHIKFTTSARFAAQGWLKKEDIDASYERACEADRRAASVLREILTIHRQMGKIAREKASLEADPAARDLLKKLSSTIGDNIGREERLLSSIEEMTKKTKGLKDSLWTGFPEDRRGAEVDRENRRTAAESAIPRRQSHAPKLDDERTTTRQSSRQSDADDEKAKKLLYQALRLDLRGGFDKEVRKRLQEIIDKYPGTPSAERAQQQLDKMTKPAAKNP